VLYLLPALMQGNRTMKLKTVILSLTLSAPVLFAGELLAQDQRADSIQAVNNAIEVKVQEENDAERLSDAKDERRRTKAKAKEAARVEREASDAARESKNALRTEKKAQKARKQADAQAKKASKARTKSEKN
jgi:hypothetical protein